MQFSEAIIPLVSILTVISSLLIHWNSLDAASKRWRLILLCVLVVVAIVITASCIGYEVNRKSAEQEALADGSQFELTADGKGDQPALPVSDRVDNGQLEYEALRGAPFKAYGYQFRESDLFFVENEPEVKYAEPINRVSKSDIGLIEQGYDIWVRFSYEFSSITKAELDAISVGYALFMPNDECREYPDGTLGDGSRIEYERMVMPSMSGTFTDYRAWPSGRYSLCLLLNGEYAGETQFRLIYDLDE